MWYDEIMDNTKKLLIIEEHVDCTTIINRSGFNVFVSIKPKKPKRKHVGFSVVESGYFNILDKLDLSHISITFEPTMPRP